MLAPFNVAACVDEALEKVNSQHWRAATSCRRPPNIHIALSVKLISYRIDRHGNSTVPALYGRTAPGTFWLADIPLPSAISIAFPLISQRVFVGVFVAYSLNNKKTSFIKNQQAPKHPTPFCVGFPI